MNHSAISNVLPSSFKKAKVGIPMACCLEVSKTALYLMLKRLQNTKRNWWYICSHKSRIQNVHDLWGQNHTTRHHFILASENINQIFYPLITADEHLSSMLRYLFTSSRFMSKIWLGEKMDHSAISNALLSTFKKAKVGWDIARQRSIWFNL